MENPNKFFAHAAKANLTGEQCRVLFCLLSEERDRDISIRQNQIAEILGMTESNVSRAVRALKEAGLLSRKDANGYDGKPVLMIDKTFDYGSVSSKYLI